MARALVSKVRKLHKENHIIGIVSEFPKGDYDLLDDDNNRIVHPKNAQFKMAYAIFNDAREQFKTVLDSL